MSHDTYRNLLGLDALEPAQARRMAAHVRGCRDCRTELDELRETAAGLGHAATPLTPSARTGASILAIPDGVRPSRRRRAFRVAAGIAAGVAITLGAALVHFRSELRGALARLDRAERFARLLASPDVAIVPLWGDRSQPGLHAKIALDRRTRQVTLLSSTLPEAPEGSAYQLWYISERVRPAGIFPAGGDLTRFGDVPHHAAFFALTLESEKGAEEPTGSMILMSRPLRERE